MQTEEQQRTEQMCKAAMTYSIDPESTASGAQGHNNHPLTQENPMNILHIDSSITGEKSISRLLSGAIVRKLAEHVPTAKVTYRNLDTEPATHLSSATLSGQNPQDAAAGKAMLEEFKAADVVVIGAPMYNFTVPSQLKAWIDRIAVSGETFRYTANGPVGLAGDKRVIIASVRGGFYHEASGLAALDHQESYLRTVFGFLGITDVEFIRAEGVNISQDQAAESIRNAHKLIHALTQAPHAA